MTDRTDAEKFAFSRSIPRTLTAVEWHAIMVLLQRGLETNPRSWEEESFQTIREKVLPALEKDVAAMIEIEPSGMGLNHPTRRAWMDTGEETAGVAPQ